MAEASRNTWCGTPSPDVSPDGKVIAYSTRENAEWDLVVQPFDPPGEPSQFLVHRPPGADESPKPLVHVLLDWTR